jgi:hypothetical protein
MSRRHFPSDYHWQIALMYVKRVSMSLQRNMAISIMGIALFLNCVSYEKLYPIRMRLPSTPTTVLPTDSMCLFGGLGGLIGGNTNDSLYSLQGEGKLGLSCKYFSTEIFADGYSGFTNVRFADSSNMAFNSAYRFYGFNGGLTAAGYARVGGWILRALVGGSLCLNYYDEAGPYENLRRNAQNMENVIREGGSSGFGISAGPMFLIIPRHSKVWYFEQLRFSVFLIPEHFYEIDMLVCAVIKSNSWLYLDIGLSWNTYTESLFGGFTQLFTAQPFVSIGFTQTIPFWQHSIRSHQLQ